MIETVSFGLNFVNFFLSLLSFFPSPSFHCFFFMSSSSFSSSSSSSSSSYYYYYYYSMLSLIYLSCWCNQDLSEYTKLYYWWKLLVRQTLMRHSGDKDTYRCIEWVLKVWAQCFSGIRPSTCFEYFLSIVHFNAFVVMYFLFWKQWYRIKLHLRNTLATVVCPWARYLSKDVPADAGFIWNISDVFMGKKTGHMCVSNQPEWLLFWNYHFCNSKKFNVETVRWHTIEAWTFRHSLSRI